MAAPYAATQLTGVLGVEDVLEGKQIRDVTKGLFMIVDQNHLAPFLAVQSKKAVKTGRVARNPKIEWTQKDIFPRWDTVATGDSAGTTITIDVTNHSYFQAGDVVEFPEMTESSTTTNVMYVSSVGTDPALTFSPVGFQSDGSTARTCPAATAGMKIHILANAMDEYSQKPTAKYVKDVQEYNYVQFLRVPYVIGNIEEEIAQYTGPERTERRVETMKEIKMSMEKQMIWGERYYVAGSDGRKYFMKGIWRYVEDGAGVNILTDASNVTESQLDEYLVEGPCKWGSQRKYWFMSSDLFLRIHELAKNKERIVKNSINSLGLAVLEYLAPNGKRLYMVQHYMFEEYYEGGGLIVDPDYCEMRPYGTQGTLQLHQNIQENDRAGIADEWRILASLQVDRIEPHGIQLS